MIRSSKPSPLTSPAALPSAGWSVAAIAVEHGSRSCRQRRDCPGSPIALARIQAAASPRPGCTCVVQAAVDRSMSAERPAGRLFTMSSAPACDVSVLELSERFSTSTPSAVSVLVPLPVRCRWARCPGSLVVGEVGEIQRQAAAGQRQRVGAACRHRCWRRPCRRRSGRRRPRRRGARRRRRCRSSVSLPRRRRACRRRRAGQRVGADVPRRVTAPVKSPPNTT